jgi:hypothetical protein
VKQGLKRHCRAGVWPLFAAVVLALATGGCSARKAGAGSPGPSPARTASDEAGGAKDSATGPSVTISYAHSGDYLRTMSVTKYESAQVIATRNQGAKDAGAILRFEGGVVIWQVESGGGIFSHAKYRIGKVNYGKVPDGFSQVIPDSGLPEPMEPGHYYVFSVQRASGSRSFEAVKVRSDGMLEGYGAEPRAGSSYELCCNLSPDFARSAAAQDSGSSDSP